MSAPVSSPPSARAEAIDLLGDEALVERDAARVSISSSREPPRLSSTMRRYVAASAGLRKSAPASGAGRYRSRDPGQLAEELLVELDRRADPLVERIAVLGVADRELEHVLEPPGTELAQEEQPTAERARDAGGEDDRCPGSARARARGSARSWPQPARRPVRRARAARRALPTRRRPAPLRPGPFRCGSTTWSTKPVATAASNALPPRSSTAIPVCDASQWVDATIPKVPRSSGRVVNFRDAPRSTR